MTADDYDFSIFGKRIVSDLENNRRDMANRIIGDKDFFFELVELFVKSNPDYADQLIQKARSATYSSNESNR